MFEVGEVVTIHYPLSTHVRHIEKAIARPRQIVVRSIRDLVAEPLTPEEFLRRPFIRRSRWLIKGYEPEHKRFRQFYTGSSIEFAAPSQLRVALYEPGATKPKQVLFRAIEPTVRDRKLLSRALLRWTKRQDEQLQMRIYADDFRLHT
ncbi:MAG: hypothetical protein ACO1RT_13220 [Planctomycetaceae bacterium]